MFRICLPERCRVVGDFPLGSIAGNNYCWSVESIDDFKLAPFHILATEGRVQVQQNHQWYMQKLAGICAYDSQLLLATPYRLVDVTSRDQVADAARWWLDLTECGGEGMVVKPLDFIAKGKNGLLQPAVKCRGREYLRIIYGPDYMSVSSQESVISVSSLGSGLVSCLLSRQVVRATAMRKAQESGIGGVVSPFPF